MAKQCKNILSKFIRKNKKKPLQKKKRNDLVEIEKGKFKGEKRNYWDFKSPVRKDFLKILNTLKLHFTKIVGTIFV